MFAMRLRRCVRWTGLCALIWLPGCALLPEPAPREPQPVTVQTLDRSADCQTESRSAAVQFFADGVSFQRWQQQRGTRLSTGNAAAGEPLVLVEMGRRNTGGYFLTVDDAAVLDTDDILQLRGTWTRPGADRITTQIITSPCVLLAVPDAAYRGFRIVDQNNELRASLTLD